MKREQSENRAKVLARYASGIAKTEGTTYSTALRSISAGQFDKVVLDDWRNQKLALVSGYFEAFWSSCEAALPGDKVQITSQECEREAWQVNNRGFEVMGSRHCASYRTVGTGKYADPEVAHLYVQLNSNLVGNAFKELFTSGQNPNDFLAKKLQFFETVSKDMRKLLALNGCATEVTKRFQLNLIRYGWDRQPLAVYEPVPSKPFLKDSIVQLKEGSAFYGARWCGKGCKGSDEPVEQMLVTPDYPRGLPVRQCDYETPTGTHAMYFFWPNVPPANIKSLLAADSHGILRYLGTKGTKTCPATPEEALQLRQAAMVETGFPPQ